MMGCVGGVCDDCDGCTIGVECCGCLVGLAFGGFGFTCNAPRCLFLFVLHAL